MILWKFTQEKAKARQFALPLKPIKRGIWLPGDQALCVKSAYDLGLLSNIQIAYLVERDYAIYQKMVETTSDLPGRRPFYGNLDNLVLDGPIDYAYLDYYGGINKRNALWMAKELSPHLEESATICITQMLAARNNPLMRNQDKLLRTDAGSFIRNHYGSLKIQYQRLLLLIHRIFRKWDFEIVPNDRGSIYEYSDSVTTMLLLKLVAFRLSPHQYLFPEVS